jgi:hypothetical protein
VPWRGLRQSQVLERLGAAECWRVLEAHRFGRLCFCTDDRVEVAMTPYVAGQGRIHLRAAAFGPLARRVLARPVTLQLDDLQGDQQASWAVTVTGAVHPVEDAATLAALWTPVRPAPWATGREAMWVELVPDDVRGQRSRA